MNYIIVRINAPRKQKIYNPKCYIFSVQKLSKFLPPSVHPPFYYPILYYLYFYNATISHLSLAYGHCCTKSSYHPFPQRSNQLQLHFWVSPPATLPNISPFSFRCRCPPDNTPYRCENIPIDLHRLWQTWKSNISHKWGQWRSMLWIEFG